MKTSYWTAVAFLFMHGMYLTACSGSATPPAHQQTSSDASRLAAGTAQAESAPSGSLQTFNNLTQLGLSVIGSGAPEIRTLVNFKPSPALRKTMAVSSKFAESRAARSAATSVKRALGIKKTTMASALATSTTPTTYPCLDGGSYLYGGTSDPDTGTYDYTIQFTNCRENNMEYNGDYHLQNTLQGPQLVQTYKLGTTDAPLALLEYAGSAYTNLISRMETTMTLEFMEVPAAAAGATATYTTTANGSMLLHDYLNSEDYSLTYTDFSDVYTISGAMSSLTTAGTYSYSETMNGSFTETWADSSSAAYAATLAYQTFTVGHTIVSTGIPSTSYDDKSMSGNVTMNYAPDTCANGTFAYETPVPIRTRLSDYLTIDGTLVINSATTFVYNSDGSIDATTAGDGSAPTHYASEYDLMAFEECSIGAF